nr:uncharacterized protein LOC124494896 [Dermatophagoides farinae]
MDKVLLNIISGIKIISQFLQYEFVKNSSIMKFSIMIEVILFIHNSLAINQCAMLLYGTIWATYYVFRNQLAHINQNFMKILRNSRQRKPINMTVLKELRFIHIEHNTLAYYVLQSDKYTLSRPLYYFALVSIPINVLFMCELIVEDIPAQTQFVFIVMSSVHAITGLIPFITLALVSSAFHKIKDYIPAMQLRLNRSTHIRMKLKYDDLYERLMFGKKIAFTFGYLGDLTYRGLFEAFLGYFAAFFLIMGFYMREHST